MALFDKSVADVEKPPKLRLKHLEYLDVLRRTGITNMYGAAVYLQNAFKLKREDASKILVYWMQTFANRKARGETGDPL